MNQSSEKNWQLKNWKKQIGLTLILVALGSAVLWDEFKRRPAKETAEENSKLVFQLKDTSLKSIRLTDGQREVLFECTDETGKLCKSGDQTEWKMSAPLKLKADSSNVNALVSTLGHLNPSSTIDLKEETATKKDQLLKQYGLTPDALKKAPQVEVTTTEGSIHLYFGDTHPIGNGIFAIKANDDSKVFLIPTYFKANLERDLTYWRDKKLFSVKPHEIASFEARGSKGSYSVEKTDGKWSIKLNGKPGGKSPMEKTEVTGDADSIDALLSSALYLSAKSFPTDQKDSPSAKAVLKGYSPALTLQFQMKPETKSDPISLVLYRKGNQNDKILATVSTLDPLVELESSTLGRLEKAPKDLRLTRLMTTMDRFSTKRVEFKSNALGTPLTLISKDGKWQKENDSQKESSQDLLSKKAQTVLEKLSSHLVQDFLTASSAPAHDPKDELTLIVGNDKEPAQHQFAFWKKGESLYAKNLAVQSGEVYLIDPKVSEALPWAPEFFQK
jgi:hypothetical protein